MNRPIAIILADDHALVRTTLRRTLEAEPDFKVVSDVGTADDAVRDAEQLKPDIVVLDIDMPGQVAFDAARRIQAGGARVVFLSAFFHDRYIDQALMVGASAYITKNERPEVVVRAIRAVAAGSAYYSPDVQARIVIGTGGPRLGGARQTRGAGLTRRELQVLQYIARGLSKREIAEVLRLSERTVNCHTASMMAKLDIHDRVQLARYAIREGLAEP
ncbi:MAG: response regulator transcription factor [Planctomycetota bacterium]